MNRWPSLEIAVPTVFHHLPYVFGQTISKIRIGVRRWLQRAPSMHDFSGDAIVGAAIVSPTS